MLATVATPFDGCWQDDPWVFFNCWSHCGGRMWRREPDVENTLSTPIREVCVPQTSFADYPSCRPEGIFTQNTPPCQLSSPRDERKEKEKRKKENKRKRKKKKNSWSTPLVAPTPSCPCPCPCPSSPSPRPPCPRPPPRRRPRPRPCHPRPPRPPRLQSRSYCPPSFPSSPWSS